MSGSAKQADTPQSPTQATAPPDNVMPPAVATPPPPEPLTPERAAAENRRNDLFILGAVLISAFLLGSFKITDSDLWLRLRSGLQIDQQGVPDRDSFAYSTQDQKWINSSWLFDWGLYRLELIEARMQVHRLVADYRSLLAQSKEPKLDNEGRQVGKPPSEDAQRKVAEALDNFADTAKTSDTQQMRIAAERTAEIVRSSGIELPRFGIETKSPYPALSAYHGAGGESLVRFMSPVIIKSILLVALAAVLLCIRHPGPTGWWTAVVTAIALVGMSDRFTLSPGVFGLFGLACVFCILHAFQTGRAWAVWLLIPLQLLWVNVDASFALGFVIVAVVLVSQVVGQGLGRRRGSEHEGKPAVLAAAFLLSMVATIANPFGFRVWEVPFEWTRHVLGRGPYVAASVASLFGSSATWVRDALARGADLHSLAPDMFTPLGRGYARLLQNFVVPPVAALVLMLASFGSFLLNRRRLRWSRLLVLMICVGMFLFAFRYIGVAVLASCVMLSLNGQEWFLDRFGTETRITRGWWVWSQAGRAATVLGLVLVAIAGITGWLGTAAGGEFGFGVQWVNFDLEMGKLLRKADLKGKVLNTVPSQGNLLLWSNHPPTQVYVDSREFLHRTHLAELESLKLALRGDEATLPEMLDKYGISHVILNIMPIADSITFPRTFARMNRDEKWALVHLSANSALFGRVGVKEGELAADARWFEQNAFDPARLVYAEDADPLPEPPGPVNPPSWIDVLWRRRRIFTSQAVAAGHYLTPATLRNPPSADAPPTSPMFVVPTENCYLAIRDARRGLADDAARVSPLSYAVLSKAYYYLYNTEMFVAPVPDMHNMRLLQLVTALNQLVAANPKDKIAQLQLALRYRMLGILDLADHHFDAVIKLMPPDDRIENFLFDGGQVLNMERADVINESDNIKAELERVDYDMNQLGAQLANPVAKATFLMRRGCLGRAIEQLNEAYAFNAAVDVFPSLARLYLRIGQPGDTERGADHQMINMQGTGGMRPGEKEELWALIKLMQGDYHLARKYMEAAIADTRISMTKESIMSLTSDLRGGLVTQMAVAPISSAEDVERLIQMEHHLALIHLEAGEPREAAKHFKQAIGIRPDTALRPLIAFYIEKITGEKLEPLPEPPPDDAERPADSAAPADTAPQRPAELPAKPDAKSNPAPEGSNE
jgi:tetratricopeptide (TPR) repeat protein